jgi:hypothetical protein
MNDLTGAKILKGEHMLFNAVKDIHFRSMEAPQNKSDVTTNFQVGGLVIHFAGIFHLSCSVQKLFKNFMLVQWLKNVCNFWGKYDP